jgi:hypothetical protein
MFVHISLGKWIPRNALCTSWNCCQLWSIATFILCEIATLTWYYSIVTCNCCQRWHRHRQVWQGAGSTKNSHSSDICNRMQSIHTKEQEDQGNTGDSCKGKWILHFHLYVDYLELSTDSCVEKMLSLQALSGVWEGVRRISQFCLVKQNQQCQIS